MPLKKKMMMTTRRSSSPASIPRKNLRSPISTPSLQAGLLSYLAASMVCVFPTPGYGGKPCRAGVNHRYAAVASRGPSWGILPRVAGRRMLMTGPIDAMIRAAVSRMLDRMVKIEKIKALPVVTGWSWLELARVGSRAKDGQPLEEPEGANRELPGLDDLMFVPAQLARLPLLAEESVDTSVTIGPQAAKPMHVPTRVLITGMGYGVSVSKQAKLAMAKASRLAEQR